jgi:hypothetical protein
MDHHELADPFLQPRGRLLGPADPVPQAVRRHGQQGTERRYVQRERANSPARYLRFTFT